MSNTAGVHKRWYESLLLILLFNDHRCVEAIMGDVCVIGLQIDNERYKVSPNLSQTYISICKYSVLCTFDMITHPLRKSTFYMQSAAGIYHTGHQVRHPCILGTARLHVPCIYVIACTPSPLLEEVEQIDNDLSLNLLCTEYSGGRCLG